MSFYDELARTRVVLRQPVNVVSPGTTTVPSIAEVATYAETASYAHTASYIAPVSGSGVVIDGNLIVNGLLSANIINVPNTGQLETIFYVTQEGSDTYDGKKIDTAFRTIKKAMIAASESIASYTGSVPQKISVQIKTGYYLEEAPIWVPPNTSILGDDLRTVVVAPTPATKNENLFLMNNGTYAWGLRLEGCEIDSFENPRKGFFFAFAPGAYIVTSPYIQNCTAAHTPQDKFYVPLDYTTGNPEVGNGPGGMIIDDSILDGYSPLKSMIVDAYTQVAFNGIGLVVRGAGYAQMVSFFTNFSHVGVWAIEGGHASLLNSNTTFGDYGLKATGKRILAVPDVSQVSEITSSIASSILQAEKSSILNYMISKLQVSGSYSASYLDTGSSTYKSTIKDGGIFVDALVSDLKAKTPGRTVQFTQGLFDGQDVSSGSIYTLPTTSSQFDEGPILAAFPVNDIFRYNEVKCKRDVGYILDAFSTDILYGGNERTIKSGIYYYKYPSEATTTQLAKTLEGLDYANKLTQQLISSGSGSTQTSNIQSLAETLFYIIENGTGSLPPTILNTQNNIKWTNIAQYTGSSNPLSAELNKVSSSFALVTNVVTNGTGSLPSLVLNTSQSIKYTSTPQVTSLSTSSIVEATKISSSVAFIINVITNGTSSLPPLVSNADANIKFTTSSQDTDPIYTFSNGDLISVSSSIALVYNIVKNGTGSLPPIIPYGPPSTNITTLKAYNLIKNNITFIQNEVIAYISSSWSTASYDEVKCRRDIGYIVSGAAQDLLYGGNSASLANGLYYYLFPSQATTAQLNFTLDAIEYTNRITQTIVKNITFVTASAARRNAWNLLNANKNFIQDETIAYLSSSWYGFNYDSAKCRRDVGYIIDGIATDIYYGGNQRSRESGRYYYLYPSQATGSQLDQTVDGIEYASVLAQKVIQGITFVTASESRLAVRDILYNNIELLQEEAIAYISSSWSTASYDETKCKRDIGYIVGGIIADVLYGGNQRTIDSAVYYYKYPSQATTTQLDFTVDAINYVSGVSQKLLTNTVLQNASNDVITAYETIRQQKQYIQNRTIDSINDALVFDFIRAWRYVKEYIIDDPDGKFGTFSLPIKEKISQLVDIPINTIYSVVINLETDLLQIFGSLITSTSHDFSYAGSGVNFLGLPSNQGGIGASNFDIRVFQEGGGRVYTTYGDETGDFYAGNDFVIKQSTGIIQGRTFNKAIAARFTPLNLALEG